VPSTFSAIQDNETEIILLTPWLTV
jgi:hypothetical protein